MKRNIPARDLFLVAACMSIMVVMGGAIYEHIAIMPRWTHAPPASLTMFQGPYGINPARFWMLIHPLTLTFIVIALILNWKTSRRTNILITLGGYVLILFVTFVYFVPNLLEIINTPLQSTADSALVRRANMWEIFSLMRNIIMFFLIPPLLFALTKGNDPKVIHHDTRHTSAPLSYPNDSLGG